MRSASHEGFSDGDGADITLVVLRQWSEDAAQQTLLQLAIEDAVTDISNQQLEAKFSWCILVR